MVSLELANGIHILEILTDRPDLSILVWLRVFEDIQTSAGTVEQSADLAYNLGGSRANAYRNAAVPTEIARQAAREFPHHRIAADGRRMAGTGRGRAGALPTVIRAPRHTQPSAAAVRRRRMSGWPGLRWSMSACEIGGAGAVVSRSVDRGGLAL
jgi:hypothetical protein